MTGLISYKVLYEPTSLQITQITRSEFEEVQLPSAVEHMGGFAAVES